MGIIAYSFWAIVGIIIVKLGSPFFSPLRSIPGPLLARWTKLWYAYRLWTGEFVHDNIALHKRHGQIVRYGPNRYSFDSPEAIKKIYDSKADYEKSAWYKGWAPPDGTRAVFTECSKDTHSALRRKLHLTYSMASVRSYEGLVDECTMLLLQRFSEFAQQGKSFDFAWWAQCFTTDVVSSMTLSNRFGNLDAGKDVGQLNAFIRSFFYMNSFFGLCLPLRYAFLALGAVSQRLGLASKEGPEFVVMMKKRIEERRRAGKDITKKHEDFFAKFEKTREQDPSTFDVADSENNVIANATVGADTTASTLSAIIYYLVKSPQSLARLRKEIESSAPQNLVSYEQTSSANMPYFQAVIKETMRMHGGVGLPLERVVPASGLEICGRFFPAGSIVGVNPWVVHYNTAVFGADADVFRPERWLEADEDHLTAMKKSWIPFGAGPRICIGQNISMLEIAKLIPELVRRFDFEFEFEGKGKGKEWELEYNWFVTPKNMFVKVNHR